MFSSLYVWLTKAKYKFLCFSRINLIILFPYVGHKWLHYPVLKFNSKYLELVLLKFDGIDGAYLWKTLHNVLEMTFIIGLNKWIGFPPFPFVCLCLIL